MPEGHTLHRLAAAFAHGFGGQRVRVSSPQGRFADAAALDRWVMTRAEAVGKHLFLAFAPSAEVPPEDDPTRFVHVHLGLYGSFTFAGDPGFATLHAIGAPRIDPRTGRSHEADPLPRGDGAQAVRVSEEEKPAAAPADWRESVPRPTTRLRVVGEQGLADLTGPTACELMDHEGRQRIIDRLGPDPLRTDADPVRFRRRVLRSRSPIGVQLMNQEVVAGIGNIYRAELLFRARLDPFVPGTELSAGIVDGLWEDLVPLMAYGARTGRIVTTQPEHRRIHAELMEPAHRTRQNSDGDPDAVPRLESFYVYHRQTLPCRLCDRPVRTQEIAGRALYWCGHCQKELRRRSPWTRQNPADAWAYDGQSIASEGETA